MILGHLPKYSSAISELRVTPPTYYNMLVTIMLLKEIKTFIGLSNIIFTKVIYNYYLP